MGMLRLGIGGDESGRREIHRVPILEEVSKYAAGADHSQIAVPPGRLCRRSRVLCVQPYSSL